MFPALKTAAMSGALGLAGAGVADMTVNDAMDRSASSLQELRDYAASLDPRAMQVVLATVNQAPDPVAREMIMDALKGTPAEQILAGMPAAPKEFKAAVKLASQVSAGAPDLAAAALGVGQRMTAFDAEAAERGQSIDQVVPALEAGAGTSPLPALLGGAGLGSGGAILQHLLNRMDAKANEPSPAVNAFKMRRS